MNKSFSLADMEDEEAAGTPPAGTNPDDTVPPETTEEEGEEEEEEEDSQGDPPPAEAEEDEPEEEEGDGNEEEDADADDSATYFEALEEEIQLGIDYSEIDFEGEDPLTPKGIAKVIQHANNTAIDRFDSYLKNTFPDAYAHLLASQAGISSKEFFENKENNLESIPSEEVVTNSIEMQRELVRNDLIAKGIKKEVLLDNTIAQYEEDDELLEEAKKVLEAKTAVRDARIAELDRQATQKVEEERAILRELDANLATVIATGNVGKNLNIPKKDRATAVKSFKDSLRIENGKVVQVIEIDPKDVTTAFGRSYLGSKADLSKIVETKAKTLNTLRLKNFTEENSKTSKAQRKSNKAMSVPLGELEDE